MDGSNVASARVDPALEARVVTRKPLVYRDGADATLDRPAHVRAGSALVSLGDALAVIQDDASFLAIIDPPSGQARAIPFPGGGVRQFDDTRGNKKLKLDLEAAFAAPDGKLVLLGSGSSAKRERVVIVEAARSDAPRVVIVEAPELYAELRGERSFAGSELNIEGAAVVDDDLVLFQRGNGAPHDGLLPVDATCRLPLGALLAYLAGRGPAPRVARVVQWTLGSLDRNASSSTRLTFTDGAVHPSGALAFLACAEDSPDATRDGPVSAVAIGQIDERAGACALGRIFDERGAPLLDKAEGLAFDPRDRKRAFVVTDRDDPRSPSELLELRLGDGW